MDQIDHREYYIGSGSNSAVVFIHGFLGSPNQFRFMAERLSQQGCDCRALLLPGHGGSAAEFFKTPGKEWSAYAHKAIDHMRERYEHLYLVGHSMGGLISLRYAAAKRVEGVVLINTPIAIKLSLRQFSFSLKASRRSDKAEISEIVEAYRQGFGISNGKRYMYPLWIRQVISLLQLIQKCQKSLPEVNARTLIVQSAFDESVRIKSASILQTGLGDPQASILRLDRSCHCYFPSADREQMLQAITSFIHSGQT